jgi:hypothetical protein
VKKNGEGDLAVLRIETYESLSGKNELYKHIRTAIAASAAAVLIAVLVSCAPDTGNESGSPDEIKTGIYSLENPTDKQKHERLRFVNLYDDGTAELEPSLISSYIPPICTYSPENGELVLRAIIETEHDEGSSGLKNGDEVARFELADNTVLIVKSAIAPLFADEGARYALTDDQNKRAANT